MAPNLFILVRTLVTPHRWFTRNTSPELSLPTEEFWTKPIPGTYRYKPRHGWYLVRLADDTPISPPRPIVYSRVLKRYLFEDDFYARKHRGCKVGIKGEVGFFRLDDGVSWVNTCDGQGNFVPGPWERWCLDKEAGFFRPMLRKDDPLRKRKSDTEGGLGSAAPSVRGRQIEDLLKMERWSFHRDWSTPVSMVGTPSESQRQSRAATPVTSPGGSIKDEFL